jgi:hypothetical protein
MKTPIFAEKPMRQSRKEEEEENRLLNTSPIL